MLLARRSADLVASLFGNGHELNTMRGRIGLEPCKVSRAKSTALETQTSRCPVRCPQRRQTHPLRPADSTGFAFQTACDANGSPITDRSRLVPASDYCRQISECHRNLIRTVLSAS